MLALQFEEEVSHISQMGGMGAGVVSSRAIMVAQAAVRAGGCIAGAGIASLLFIPSFLHSFQQTGCWNSSAGSTVCED